MGDYRVDWKVKLGAYLCAVAEPLEPKHEARRDGAASALTSVGQAPDHSGVERFLREARGLERPPLDRPLAAAPWVAVHPLAGTQLPLGGPRPEAQALGWLRTEANHLLSPFNNNDRLAYLAIWRKLRDRMRGRGGFAYWDILPADEAWPWEPVWTHAGLAAACAGAGECPALFSFTIASPQEFIGASRRTQDFWMGSYLMSWLTGQAILKVAEAVGPDAVLFPSLYEQPLVDVWLAKEGVLDPGEVTVEQLRIASLPNRFTALVPDGQADALAESCAQAARGAFVDLADRVRTRIEGAVKDLPTDYWTKTWQRQAGEIVDQLGIFWSIVPLARGAGSPDEQVEAAYQEAEQLLGRMEDTAKVVWDKIREHAPSDATLSMAYGPVSRLGARVLDARKMLRDFRQGAEAGERCSLCGQREALRMRENDGHQAIREFWETLRGLDDKRGNGIKLAGRLRRGEQLCAVCLTRRLAWEHAFSPGPLEGYVKKPHWTGERPADHLLFPSTASIATASFRARLLEHLLDNADLWDTFERFTGQLRAFLERHGWFYPSAPLPYLDALRKRFDDGRQPTVEGFLWLDGDWLYPESYESEGLRWTFGGNPPDETTRVEALEGLKALLGKARKAGLGVPSRYLAVLAMDGDNMGEWIGGRRGPTLGELCPGGPPPWLDYGLRGRIRPLGPAAHLLISEAMQGFALHVAQPVVEGLVPGSLVFAGGDDVQALLPVEALPKVLRALSGLFSDLEPADQYEAPIGQWAAQLGLDASAGYGCKDGKRSFLLPSKRFGVSAGVAVVHHSHPLTQALETSYKVLKDEAKERLGRAAWAVSLFKRSGAPATSGAPWQIRIEQARLDTLGLLEALADAMRTGRLSRELPYALDQATGALSDWGGGHGPRSAATELKTAQVAELHRVLGRRCASGFDPRPLADGLAALLSSFHGSSFEPEAWARLVRFMLLARFLAGEG